MAVLSFRCGNVEVNDVFTSSCGWEQTNVTCYQVVSVHGTKTVVVREIQTTIEQDPASMSGHKKAVLNDFVGEPIKRQVKDISDRPFITICESETAYKSDPDEAHCFTSYA